MKFCEYRSLYSARRCFDVPHLPDEFYLQMLKSLPPTQENRPTVNCLLAERSWYCDGRPYYKVWPAMIDAFVRTPLNVPVEYLRLPYPVFMIRLPDEPILDFAYGGARHFLRAILVNRPEVELDVDCAELREGRTLTIWMDFGESTDVFTPIVSFRTADFSAALTLEEGLAARPGRHSSSYIGLSIPESVVESAFRLAVAVCFVATGASRATEFDVLQRHLDAYRKAAEGSEERRRYEEKSKRYGQFGWHIGRDRTGRDLHLARRGMTYEEAVNEAGGTRKLKWQHKRGAHWHTVKFGPKHGQGRVDWFEETTVKPELPPKPVDV